MTTERSNRNAGIHSSIGMAIHAHAHVEAAQVRILETILKIDTPAAAILFFSVQNVRTRNEMLGGLLNHYYKSKFRFYWAKCSAFLFKLSLYRNAIVHWHPGFTVQVDQAEKRIKQVTPFIYDPKRANKNPPKLESANLQPFLEDCAYIDRELTVFGHYLKHGPQSWLDKYQRQAIHPNRAVLRQPQIPKAQQPQRPPSQESVQKAEKPSARQRRERALSAARRKQQQPENQ